MRETLNKSTFYGKPPQLYEAAINKIKVLASLILPKVSALKNQRLLSNLKIAAQKSGLTPVLLSDSLKTQRRKNFSAKTKS